MSKQTARGSEELPTRRRGLFLLPNLFTTGSIFAGFYAIVASMHGQFVMAVIAIFIAMIFDSLDGRVARLINAQSAFGAEYDSLADMVAFGVSPALVAYQWSLASLGMSNWGKIGWLSAFMYVACVALRLARFNVAENFSKRYFIGLPCPAAAGLVASFVWFSQTLTDPGVIASILTIILLIVVSLLQVSNIRYRSFKDYNMKENMRFVAIFLIVILYIFISLKPAVCLFALTGFFALSGPVWAMFERIPGLGKMQLPRRDKKKKQKSASQATAQAKPTTAQAKPTTAESDKK